MACAVSSRLPSWLYGVSMRDDPGSAHGWHPAPEGAIPEEEQIGVRSGRPGGIRREGGPRERAPCDRAYLYIASTGQQEPCAVVGPSGEAAARRDRRARLGAAGRG